MNFQDKNQLVFPPKHEAGEDWASAPLSAQGQKGLRMPPGYENDGSFGDDSSKPAKAALVRGYSKPGLQKGDDGYTSQKTDTFYAETDGFLERNNYLDRL